MLFFHGNHRHYLNFHSYQIRSWHFAIKSVVWKSLWPKENLMHLICKMFYFCFHFNHSHNLRLKVYLVVSLVISYEKYMLSGCELIDTENISLGSQNMKFDGEWAKRTIHKLHILSSRLIFFSINHIQMTCLSSLDQI